MLMTNRKLEMANFGMERTAANSMKLSMDGIHERHSMTSRIPSSLPMQESGEDFMKLEKLSPEKQLAKLKRFLQTVFRFGENLPSQRSQVRQLIVDLLNAVITSHDFYTELRETTKFPLRPFVVPFLEASLPLLRMSIKMPVRMDSLEMELFESSSALGQAENGKKVNSNDQLVMAHDLMDRRKRKAMESSLEQGLSPSPKRTQFAPNPPAGLISNSLSKNSLPPLSLVSGSSAFSLRKNVFASTAANGTTPMLTMSNGNGWTGMTNAIGTTGQVELARTGENGNQNGVDWWASQNEEWKNIETLFSTLSTTLERLRYGLLLFQQRARLTQLWNEKFQQHQHFHDSNVKIEEIQRRADAAVQEVKRAAVAELQKAVCAAEEKALNMIATERAQMEKLLRETQVQAESSETCRNCGRRAGQSCGGCGKARYCGVFCQHKDWSRHRSNCAIDRLSSTSSDIDFGTSADMNGTTSLEGHGCPTGTALIRVKTESPVHQLTAGTKGRTSPKSV